MRDAGLLEVLLPPFERETGYTVRVVAVGSGQAMELGRRGEADILILHAPAQEEEFVARGFGVDRRSLMRNEFVIVGPPDDPAGVRGGAAVPAARRIARGAYRWVSRGDSSGTHFRELMLWRRAGITPAGNWYRETGQGMGATLVIADQLRAYTVTDIGTFLAHRAPLELDILVSGDSLLQNPYHVIRANPARFPRVNVEGARALAAYLTGARAQAMIADFGVERFGRPLFVPTADPAGTESRVPARG